MENLFLQTLSIYPVKSLRGYDIAASSVERMGLQYDRRLMVVDEQGDFVTQREFASMALISTNTDGTSMTLSAPGISPLTFALQTSGRVESVNIWKSKFVAAIHQGHEAAEWLSHYLDKNVHLVHIADGYKRKVSSEHAVLSDDHVSFADGYPILVISQASLDDLNSRLPEPVQMNRFRPNLVTGGSSPFAEDGWKRIRVGEVELALIKPCARCQMPNINPETGKSTKETIATLSEYRHLGGKILFGMNAIPIRTGIIKTGDQIEILE